MISKALAKILALLPFLSFAQPMRATEKPDPIFVTGWPLGFNETQKAVLSNDAIMENLVCPSLTRLNLINRRSEPLLLEKLEESDRIWRLTLAPSLTWWNQAAVSMQELEVFVRETLDPNQLTKGRFLWSVPEYSISSKDRTLSVQWAQKPAFGPYVFNDHALRKKASTSLGFECVGNWAAEADSKGLLLRDRVNKGRDNILFTQDSKELRGDRKLAFLFGEDMQDITSKKPITQNLVCRQPLDTPILTIIAWNPDGQFTRHARFRRAITHLTPRGALLRAGAGSLGDLVSGPILRAHPGYKRGLLVPAYDPAKADAILNEMGLRRLEEDGFRRDAQGKSLEVRLLTRDHEGSTLLRKVLDDSFRALGIKLSFVSEGDGTADGLLTGIATSWPDGDLTELLHSRVSNRIWPWSYQDQILDQALEAYALSLTRQNPDFVLLEKIHELVYKLEPFSVLMQHRVCLETQWPSKAKKKSEISVRNPDWFRQLIGQ